MSDAAEIIEPVGREVQFAGQTVTVTPLRVGQIPAITRALKGLNIAGDIDPVELIAEHGDEIIKAVAIATDINVADIQTAAADEFIELATVVFEVNADFFVRRLAPIVGQAMQRVATKTGGAGLTPSRP